MPDNYFASYLPFLIHILLAGGIATAIITLSWLIGQRKPTRAKMEAYECGMHPGGRLARAIFRTVLPGGDAVHFVRC